MHIDTQSPTWMTKEHQLYAESVRRFLTSEYIPHVSRWNEQGYVDLDFWRLAGKAGILGAAIPEEYGGAGAGITFDAVTTYEQALSGDFSWGFVIHTIVVQYVLAYGTTEQKQRWLPELASGKRISALAMTEPGQGSDLQSVETRAVLEENVFRVNGSKTFITNGQTANLICLVVKTQHDAGAHGVSLLMIETDQVDGFRRGQNLEKIGLKGQDTSELFLTICLFPKKIFWVSNLARVFIN